MLEINSLFRQIDLNATDCVTEDEYYQFVDSSHWKNMIREVKKEKADRLNDNLFKNMNDKKVFNSDMIQMIFQKRKKYLLKI